MYDNFLPVYLYTNNKIVVQTNAKPDKILEYYQSGRYECDYQFHVDLHTVLRQLNLYEWLPSLDIQIQALKKIKQLTLINSNCLDEDYDDEEGLCQTYKIKSLLNHLNAKDIPNAIHECETLNWESYHLKIRKLLAEKPDYEAILNRIQTTIHSEQFRIDCMLFTALFDQIHGHSLSTFIALYSQAIQYYLNYLTNQKKIFTVIFEAQQYSNIGKLPKVKDYIATLYFILRACLRFCEIIKVLTGKNNLSLKFTVIKKDIQKLMKKYPDWKFQEQKQDLFKVLPLFKQYLKTLLPLNKQKICSWCFKGLQKQDNQHSFCKLLITKKDLFN